jgi:hypothetical protein
MDKKRACGRLKSGFAGKHGIRAFTDEKAYSQEF